MITLATLPNHTAQEVFDHIAKHLLTQGEACKEIDDISEGPICRYRNSDDQSCAAGCLISPKEYHSYKFEGKGWTKLVEDKLVPQDHFELIDQLQRIHDCNPAEKWYKCLQFLAKNSNLSTANLDSYAMENNLVSV